MKLSFFSRFFGLHNISNVSNYWCQNHQNTGNQKDIVKRAIHSHSSSIQRRFDKLLILHICMRRGPGMRVIRCRILSSRVSIFPAAALNGFLNHSIALHEYFISLIYSDKTSPRLGRTTYIGMVLFGQSPISRFYFSIRGSYGQLENMVVFIKKTHQAKVKKTIE